MNKSRTTQFLNREKTGTAGRKRAAHAFSNASVASRKESVIAPHFFLNKQMDIFSQSD
jgi:hypothetical protein